jgi:hypothetical protein
LIRDYIWKLFFEILNIQKIIFKEISLIISEFNKKIGTNEHIKKARDSWLTFNEFLVDSTIQHIKEIIDTSQIAMYKKMNVSAHLEMLTFRCLVARFKLRRPTNNIMTPIEQKILFLKECKSLRNYCKTVVVENLSKMENMEHLVNQCVEKMKTTLLEIDEIEKIAKELGTLTAEEKLEVYKAMTSEFRGSGHWYQCPNGHPYTIGDCGGAVITSRCPECGAVIGGSGHNLDQNNRRDNEFEGFARNN